MAAASEAPLSARLRFSPFLGLQPRTASAFRMIGMHTMRNDRDRSDVRQTDYLLARLAEDLRHMQKAVLGQGEPAHLGGWTTESSAAGSCSLRDLAGAWRSPGFLLRASSLPAPPPAPQTARLH